MLFDVKNILWSIIFFSVRIVYIIYEICPKHTAYTLTALTSHYTITCVVGCYWEEQLQCNDLGQESVLSVC